MQIKNQVDLIIYSKKMGRKNPTHNFLTYKI